MDNKCTKHNVKVTLFCESCQELICPSCVTHAHKKHEYELLADMNAFARYREGMVAMVPALHAQAKQLKKMEGILEEKQRKIISEAEAVKKEVGETVREMMQQVEKEMKKEIDAAVKETTDLLNQQKEGVIKRRQQLSESITDIIRRVRTETPLQLLPSRQHAIHVAQQMITDSSEVDVGPRLEQTNIAFEKSNLTVHEIKGNIGFIGYSLHESKVSIVSCHEVYQEKDSAVTIAFTLPDGSPVPVPTSSISCYLASPDDSKPIQCSVKKSRKFGQYDAAFTPAGRGSHQLHVKVQNTNVKGSPVVVPVSVPPEERGNLLMKTITGLSMPTGIAVTEEGLVVVSEW